MAKLLTTLEDFMALWMNNLDFPTIRGLNTSDMKVEIVGQVLVLLNWNCWFYNLKKNNKNVYEYEKRLQMFNICNPISVDEIKKSDEMTKWPKIDCGNIFFLRLESKICGLYRSIQRSEGRLILGLWFC